MTSPGEQRRRSLPNTLVAVVCVLAVGAMAWHAFVMPVTDDVYGIFGNGIDARVYRGGALAVRDGAPLYDEPVFKQWQFTYAPFAALLMLPMAWIGNESANIGMDILNVGCLLIFVALCLRALGFRRDWRFWLVTVAFSLAVTTLEPVRTTIWHGQINLVLAVLITGCLTLPLGRWRGIGVGLAAGIKLTPMFFVLYLAAVRNWRAVLVTLATFAATVLLGLAVLGGQAWRFWTTTVHDTSRIGPLDWPPNQSLNGFLVRLDTLGIWRAPDWLWLPLGLVVGGLGLWAAVRVHRCGQILLAVTLTGLTSACISPFSWGHHWIWFVPLLLILLVQAVDACRTNWRTGWWWWPAAAATVLLTFCWYRTTYGPDRVSYRFGAFRLFWYPDASGWQLAGALIGSAAYPIVMLAAVAVTLWWTGKRDPIRFKPTGVPFHEDTVDASRPGTGPGRVSGP